MISLGLSTMGSSSACIFIDKKCIAAVEEERLTRIKNDSSFPINSIKECLKISDVEFSDIDVINISEVDTTFDELWSSKLKESEKLLACRSSETLRWHFKSKSLSDRCKILTYVNKRLKGYIIILREDSPDIGLKRLRIVDVFIENDDDLILKKLLTSSYWLAKKSGCHSLEIIGLPTALRKKIKVHCPFERKMPSWPLFYKPGSKLMAEKLKNELVWYITAYDGDSSLL